jgi:hypothetical protein
MGLILLRKGAGLGIVKGAIMKFYKLLAAHIFVLFV